MRVDDCFIVLNAAGPVLAFAQTIHMTASFLSPIAAGLFTQESVSTIQSVLHIAFYILICI